MNPVVLAWFEATGFARPHYFDDVFMEFEAKGVWWHFLQQEFGDVHFVPCFMVWVFRS